MRHPLRRLFSDPTLGLAWRRLLRLWRPIIGWSLLVWVSVTVLLTPISSALLGWSWLRGREQVVANEAILGWALTAPGLAWLVLAGSLALVGAALHFAGVFHIVTEELEGTTASLPETALRLGRDLPALARLCAATVLAGLVAAAPLAAGLWAVHALFLGAQDINFYLAERPPAWWRAVAAAAAWTVLWAVGAGWLAGRAVLALPAYLDGHRPLLAAVRRSWRVTGGEGVRVARVLGVAVAAWLGARAAIDAAVVAAGSAAVGWTASVSGALWPIVAATGGLALLSVAVDAAVLFLGIAWISTVLTKLYHEDTDLHARVRSVAPPELTERARALLARWARPGRLLPALGAAAAVSWAAGAFLLERLPEPRPVAVIAHRAGPAPAPENTLAALERSIEAGADWAEIDVQLTRDGVPVVVHDADLMRVTGDPRRVSGTDYAELKDLVQRPDDGTPPDERRVATLGDFVDRARGRIGLVVELKSYGPDSRLVPEAARALEAVPEGEAMVVSMDLDVVREARRLAPEIPVGYGAAAAVGDLSRLPVDFLAVSRQSVSPSLLRAARRRGLDVHVWTVNRPARMAELIQDGVDGIITDRPALGVAVREELAGLTAVSRLLLRFGHLLTEEQDAPADPR